MSAESGIEKPQVFIGCTPGSVYSAVGEDFLANIFDIEGEQFIDGGADSHSLNFLKKFKNSNGFFFSAPTSTNLQSSAELENVPVIANLKGGATPQLKKLATGADFHGIRSAPLFNAKYEPYVIYKSIVKGELALYVIAGDEKDAEKLSKSAGNEEELKKVAAEHGTVAVLVWKPASNSKPILRALLAGTCSFDRIQKALDKASKALPFLNAPLVRTGDKPVAPPTTSAPSRPGAKPTSKPASAPGAAARARPTTSRPAAKPSTAPARPTPAQATKPLRPQPSKPAAPASRAPPTRPATARPASSKPATAPVKSRPVAAKPEPTKARQPTGPSSITRPPVKSAKAAPQNSAAVKKPAAPSAKTTSPKPQPEVASAPPTIPPVVVTEDDSVIYVKTVENDNQCDIVVIPPTPEPTAIHEYLDSHQEDVPVSQEKIPEVVQQIENVSTSENDSSLISSEVKNVSGSTSSSVEQTPIDDPTIAQVTEIGSSFDTNLVDLQSEATIPENTEIVDLSTSTNESTLPSELSTEPDTTDSSVMLVDLGEPINSPVQQTRVNEDASRLSTIPDLSIPFRDTCLDSTLPFVSAISGIISAESTLPPVTTQTNGNIVENGNHNAEHQQQKQEQVVESSKHDLMQERSTILSNGNKGEPEYEKADPAIDDILAACAEESEKVDEQHFQQQQSVTLTDSQPLGMIKEEAIVYKGPKFARPYYLDFVTLPRNDQLETTLGKLEMREFVHKIRSRHYVLASKNIGEEVLESINYGFKLWENSSLKCTIHPTHHNQAIAQFKLKHDEESDNKNFEVCLPIANSILRDGTGEEYKVVRTALRDEFD